MNERLVFNKIASLVGGIVLKYQIKCPMFAKASSKTCKLGRVDDDKSFRMEMLTLESECQAELDEKTKDHSLFGKQWVQIYGSMFTFSLLQNLGTNCSP